MFAISLSTIIYSDLFASEEADLGPVHMNPGQLLNPEQVCVPGVNFASFCGLKSVVVHMTFSLSPGKFERWITHCTTPSSPPLSSLLFSM